MEHQSAARAAEHSVEPGALCDRDGAVEPPQPMPGLEQPGGHAQRSASSGARQRDQQFRTEWTAQGAGQPVYAGVMQERCQVLATPERMPNAFFGRYRLMAIDGTLFHTPDTKANAAAFGRSSNQYGPGAYPQVKCVLLAECGSHAVVGLEMDRYDVSEVHGAYRLLSQIGPDMLVLVDAGLISGAFIEQVRDAQSTCLGSFRSRRMGTAQNGSSLGRWLGVGVGGAVPFAAAIANSEGCGCASSPTG